MKNGVTDILNSLFASPSGKASLSQGAGSVAPKGSQPNGNTFEEVLSQLASQESGSQDSPTPETTSPPSSPNAELLPSPGGSGPSNVGGKPTASVASITEIDFTLVERVKVDNASQLAQAEQALSSLAAGLLKLMSLLSSGQGMDQSQFQSALATLTGGNISAADAKSLMDSLRAFISKVSDTNNPLSLSSDQQSAFLNQMLQQMIQGQQVLFGAMAGSTDGSGGVSAAGASGASAGDVFLQMSFSDLQIAGIQQTNSRSSSVFIDLQTFKMSATFIGTGSSGPSAKVGGGGASFNSIPLSDRLSSALNQMFSNSSSANNLTALPSSAANAPSDSLGNSTTQGGLYQSFQDLVQLLVQGGASQAVLTTFLNQQKDMTNADLKQSLAQNASMDNLVKSLAPQTEIPPVPSLETSSPGINPPDNSGASFSSQVLMEETFAQVSMAGFPGGTGVAMVSNSANPGLDTKTINTLNDTVARLSLVSGPPNLPASPDGTGKSSLTLEQLLGALNLPATGAGAATPSASTGPRDSHWAVSAPTQLGSQTTLSIPIQVGQNITTGDSTGLHQADLTVSLLRVPVPSRAPLAPSTNNEANNPAQPRIVRANGNTAPDQLSPSWNNQAPEVVQNLVTQVEADQTTVAQSTVNQGSGPNLTNLPTPQPLQDSAVGPAPPVLDNNVLPNVSNVLTPLTVPTLPGFNPGAQTQTASNPAAFAQPRPVSPVSPTAQEVVPPQPMDVQVQISNPAELPPQLNAQVPAATTVGTTVSVSTAQDVPASIVTGEAVKLTVPLVNPDKNAPLNQPTAENLVTPLSEVRPLNPQAVASVGPDTPLSTGLGTSFDQSKNTNNNSLDIQLNPNLVSLTAASLGSGANAPLAQGPGDPLNSPLNLNAAQILSQVTGQIVDHASEARAVSRLNFQLIPESLGRVTVQIALVDQSVSAKIIVSHQDVREVLQHHMVDLKAALNQAGLQIDQLQVQVQGGSSNLLAQYYQFQQEGFAYRQPVLAGPAALEEPNFAEKTGVLGEMSVRMSLLDVLA